MKFPSLAMAALLLCSCASERVVLLPAKDGRESALVLRSGAGEQVLDHPYAASLRQGGSVLAYDSTAESLQEHFGSALAAQPQRAVHFTVNFVEGSEELTPESAALLERIKAEIAARAAPEVLVVGHTDRVGTVEYNDELSWKRAKAVRSALVAAGVAENLIETAGRGEREPLIPTADGVEEPRNRRAEISVR